jgi:hypothetical protein
MPNLSQGQVEQFRHANGFNPHEESSKIWIVTLGPLELPLPNFRWRSAILAQHDANHIRTGYDTSPRGELLVASWEVGSRCYSDFRAMGLCRILFYLGLIRYPVQALAAYRAGKAVRRSGLLGHHSGHD